MDNDSNPTFCVEGTYDDIKSGIKRQMGKDYIIGADYEPEDVRFVDSIADALVMFIANFGQNDSSTSANYKITSWYHNKKVDTFQVPKLLWDFLIQVGSNIISHGIENKQYDLLSGWLTDLLKKVYPKGQIDREYFCVNKNSAKLINEDCNVSLRAVTEATCNIPCPYNDEYYIQYGQRCGHCVNGICGMPENRISTLLKTLGFECVDSDQTGDTYHIGHVRFFQPEE